MPGIRISQFMGITPELNARGLGRSNAQIAHNCLLWDGSLRPMPQWVEYKKLTVATSNSHIAEDSKTGAIIEAYDFRESIYLNGAPFADKVTVGIDQTVIATPWYTSNLRASESLSVAVQSRPLGIPTPRFVAGIYNGVAYNPMFSSSVVGYSSQNYSLKPVNRVIGVTLCRQTESGFEESTLAVIPNQSPYGIMFEGDIINTTLGIDTAVMAPLKVTHIRLYRTISGLDTGEQVANELDTDWHLIATIPITPTQTQVNFNDGGAATTDPIDLHLAKHFYPPHFNAQYFGLLEDGWFYMAASDGRIALSERYLHHAWPTENELSIPEEITDTVAHYDNIYVGTKTRPYIVAVSAGEGEQGTQTGAVPFPERIPCLPGTMVAGPAGGLYASNQGIVALTKGGQKVITAGILNADDTLFKETVPEVAGPPVVPAYKDEVLMSRTVQAVYYLGHYVGITKSYKTVAGGGYISRHAYLYNLGDDINGQKQFQQLVTMDVPAGYLGQALTTQKGLTLKYGSQLYYLPLPGEGEDKTYRYTPKLCYRWRSKKYVFPGQMTLAAGKMIKECGKGVTLNLYVDCRCVWQAEICDCQPFRIPAQIRGVEFEIEVIGESRIFEIHLASSMQELLENE